MRNSVYSIISWLFPILPSFIVTPIIISQLGNELYGVFAIVLGFVSYFFTLNIGKVVTKYVAEYQATGELDKISNTVSATLLLGFVVGSITTITITLFASAFVGDILRIPADLQRTAVIALYLGCANILVSMLGLTFQYILQGLQRFDRFMLITNSASILLAVGTLIAVLNGYGVIGLFAISLTVSVLSGLASAIMVKRLLPELRFRLRVGMEAWSEVWRYGASIMAYQLFGSLLLLFERAWITRQFGTEALTYYVIPTTLAVYLQMFVASLVLAIFPVVNQHLADREILADLYKRSNKLILMIVTFAGLTAVIGGSDFLGLWLNDEFARASFHILLVQIIVFSVVSLTMVAWQIAESFRSAYLTAVANFSWMALSVPLMIFLSIQWQTIGVAYGRLAGVVAYVPFIVYVERRFLGGTFWTYWSWGATRIAAAALIAGTAEYFLLANLATSWTTLIISILLAGVVYFSFLILFRLVGSDERSMLRSLFLRDR